MPYKVYPKDPLSATPKETVWSFSGKREVVYPYLEGIRLRGGSFKDPSQQENKSVEIFGVFPSNVTFVSSGFREPSTLDIELDYRFFPFDIRGGFFRAIQVNFYRGLLSADDYDDLKSTGRLSTSMVTRPRGAEPDFVGFVDKETVSTVKGSKVKLQCREFSGVIADYKIANRTVDVGIPIDECIVRLLSKYPELKEMKVVWVGDDSPPKIDSTYGTIFQKKSSQSQTAQGVTQKQSSTYTILEIVSDLCTLYGVSLRFKGYQLRLGSPKNLDYSNDSESSLMYFSANKTCTDIQFDHELVGAKAHPVLVSSFSKTTGKHAFAKYPELGVNVPNPIGSGSNAPIEKDYSIFNLKSEMSVEKLKRVAKNIYEDQLRKSASLSFSFVDMGLYAPNKKENMFLVYGDTVILLQDSNEDFVLSAMLLDEEKVDMLRKFGWDNESISSFVSASNNRNKDLSYSAFKVKKVTWTWSIESGCDSKVECVNFLNAGIK
jgi:hypothetical protein